MRICEADLSESSYRDSFHQFKNIDAEEIETSERPKGTKTQKSRAEWQQLVITLGETQQANFRLFKIVWNNLKARKLDSIQTEAGETLHVDFAYVKCCLP